MNFFRNPIFASFMALIILFSSCSKFDSISNDSADVLLSIDKEELSSDVQEIASLIRNQNTLKSTNINISSVDIVDNYLKEKDIDVSIFKSKLAEIDNETDVFIVAEKLKNNGDISIKQHDLMTLLLNSLLASDSDDNLNSILEDFKSLVKNEDLTVAEKNGLIAFSTIIELQIDAYAGQNGLKSAKMDAVQGVLCGMAVAGWGIAFVSLVTVTGGTAAILAGVGYSLATASLAGCFV